MNLTALAAWLWAGALLAVGVLVYLIFDRPLFYSVLMVSAPLVVYVVTHPRVALIQYILVLFVQFPVIEALPLYLIDLSAGLLVLSATVDVLSSDRLPMRFPRMTWNFVYIILAFAVCGLVGYWPELAPRRILSLGLLLAVFWSIYRLSRHTSVRWLVNWFLVAAALNSIYVIIPFIASGGATRSFGLAGVLFDDMMLVAMPLALAMYLGAERGKAALYLAGTVLCLGGLVATQCRLSIMFGLAAAVFVLAAAYVRVNRAAGDPVCSRVVRRKILLLVVVGVGVALTVIVAKEGMFAAVMDRFVQMVENPFDRYSTVSFRITLWKRALVAWVDHPVFGVGPGGFVHLYELYPSSRLSFDYHLIGHLGAHNLLLEYLAGSGLVGAAGLLALITNKFMLARRSHLHGPVDSLGERLALYAWAVIFFATSLIEGNWMWGQLSFMMIFFTALVSRQYADSTDSSVAGPSR